MVHFLIIGIQRSGTSAIHKILMQHPNVAVLTDELKISPLFTFGIKIYTFGNESQKERRLGKKKLFDAITAINTKKRTTHCGAKMCTTTSPSIARIVVDTLKREIRDLKIIIVDRSDAVAQYGSHRHAKKTGIFHSWNKGVEKLQVKKLYANPISFMQYHYDCLEIKKILLTLKNSHACHIVQYEKFAQSPIEEIKKVYHFLDLIEINLDVNSKKVLPSAEQYILNYKTLKQIELWVTNKYLNKTIPKPLKVACRIINLKKMLIYQVRQVVMIIRAIKVY